MLVGLLAISSISAQDRNCFNENLMQFTYNMPDFSGEYTAIGEYWLKFNSECSFLSNQNSKVIWYSESVAAEYQMYFDQNNFDCRADPSGIDPYLNGTDVILGPENDNACLVKFILKNENENHDLRVQYFK